MRNLRPLAGPRVVGVSEVHSAECLAAEGRQQRRPSEIHPRDPTTGQGILGGVIEVVQLGRGGPGSSWVTSGHVSRVAMGKWEFSRR